ncbi:MAG: zf-HC2 domain-containing protein [Candidatus Aminicenantes bacterium]|nr:zf-HC2 domain-containing protein [Candidatus Aminicenantes bacterium]MDH5383750.1 zf-HC2 domain-containing protein [Candidatus Aminicenantes bacterium]
MKDCKKIGKNMVAFLYGELGESEKDRLVSHIESCAACRNELEQLKKIYKGAEVLNEDIERAMATIDWESLPARIADAVVKKEIPMDRKSRRTGFWQVLFQPGFRPVYAGILLGVVLGSLVTFLIFRSQPFQSPENGRIIVPKGFYDMMELEMARRGTIDYLDKSEYLLLDFVQSSPERSAEYWRSDLASQRARDLLSKKTYIDQQLDKLQLAKAKAICDQIELLFFELMQTSEQLSAEELRKIQNLVEERQLLLKIKLVKKELEKSEV